jgi:hypothetical protein
MRSSNQKMDASMKAYVKKWMKSLDQPRPSTTLGYFFVGLFILFWSSSVTNILGYDLRKVSGSLIFIGIVFVFTLVTWSLIRLMSIIGIDRPTRSALMLSALIGPYVNLVVYQGWNSLVISHISGFIASIFAFLVSLLLDKTLAKKPERDEGLRS